MVCKQIMSNSIYTKIYVWEVVLKGMSICVPVEGSFSLHRAILTAQNHVPALGVAGQTCEGVNVYNVFFPDYGNVIFKPKLKKFIPKDIDQNEGSSFTKN